jgi:hypothetical protein
MKQLEIYIDNQKVDLHDGESIEFNVSAQNVGDISKVYGDYSQSFTLPATQRNNKIFKHYYEPDIVNGFNANTRLNAFIQINSFLYRSGLVELEGVQMQDGRPKTYTVSFYGNNTSLKDKIGEDKLADLDLTAYDHPYSDYNIKTGATGGYATGTNSSVIYPLISSDDDWYYNSNTNNHASNNIAYHTANDVHGIEGFQLKPALRISKIIDAIEAKYAVTFNSTFFGTNKFTDLFMHLNAKEGYIFSDIGTDYTEIASYTVPAGLSSLNLNYSVDFGTLAYQIIFTINGQVFSTTTAFSNLNYETVFFDRTDEGDVIQINLRGVNGRFTQIDGFDWYWRDMFVTIETLQTIGTRSHTPQLTIADVMPEMKVIDFFTGLISMFNLIVNPVSVDTYEIEPLDGWYAQGNTHDLTRHVKSSSHKMSKLALHNRIEMAYEEPECILGSRFLLNNGVSYGDLRTDFNFDGEELKVEVPFENILFESLTDEQNGSLTNVLVAKCFDREFSPVANKPILFYKSSTIDITDNPISYVNSYLSHSSVTSIWHCQSIHTSGFSINFGAEIDPLALDTELNGLYKTYYEDYITDLYNSSRRLWNYEAILPLSVILTINSNDLITIWNRNYKINSMKVDLTTGSANLELLNDV